MLYNVVLGGRHNKITSLAIADLINSTLLIHVKTYRYVLESMGVEIQHELKMFSQYRKKEPLKTAQNNKIENVAGSV